jgi:hypothetical protein
MFILFFEPIELIIEIRLFLLNEMEPFALCNIHFN